MENYNIEYKREIPKKMNLLKAEIVSFLNSEGGEIYLGVDDNGNVIDEIIEEHKKEWEEILSNWICNAFEPNVSKLISIHPDEKPFRIKIKKGDTKPYYYKDRRRNEFKRCIYKSGEYKKSCKL